MSFQLGKRKSFELGETSNHHKKKTKPDSEQENINSFTNMGTRLKAKDSKNSSKKLTIVPLKVKPKLPENFEEESWNKLKEAIKAIHNSSSVGYSLEELYKAVEDLCQHKMAAKLYERLQNECESHIKEEVKKLLGQTSDPELYLNLVNKCWKDHCDQMILIRSIFLYLDRTYVIQNVTVRSLWDMGLYLFRYYVIQVVEVEQKTLASLLMLIERERRGETIDRSLLKSLIRMFVSLQIYSSNFEKAFLMATKEFYNKEGINYMNEMEVADYLKHIEVRIHSEGERILHYLDASSRKPLIQVLENQLLEIHVDTLLTKGFDTLVENNRKEDLKRTYQLLNRIQALDKLKSAWNSYIKNTGTTIVSDPEKDKSLVQDLLDFKAKLDSILEESFFMNENFAYSLKEAFEFFINKRANKPAELIAKYIDAKLRAGNKGQTEEELEQVLDKVMVLFRYIQGKDVFEAFYKKDLSKRLLLDKSGSLDAEKSMISKLKTECGASFTNKIEGMFKDIDLSKDLMTTFKESEFYKKYQSQIGETIDMNVHVLTQGYWPIYQQIEITLPTQLAEYQEVFKKFYLSKHNGRRLMWHPSLGHCVLKANFGSTKKELSVSLFQTVVLLMFNTADSWTFKDILQTTGMDKIELAKTLQSLALGKTKVLLTDSKEKEFIEKDVFTFNKDFKNKLYRIKINSVQMKETVDEQKKTTEGVMADRQYQIDAAIVRIMKTRKQLNHNLLISELLKQLKFPAKPNDLKKRIESLIDREYLERDESNQTLYRYLA